MKRLLPLLAVLFASPVLAGNYEKKEPKVLAGENLKLAASCLDEARALSELADKASGADAELLKAASRDALEESEAWQKSAEAYSKNQIRLGENHAEKAMKYCEKRGKTGDKVAALFHQLKGKDHGKEKQKLDFEKLKAEREKLLEKP